MLTQKLYKNGNSVAVTIPKEFLVDLGLNAESEVLVKKRGKELVVTSARKTVSKNVNNKFARMVDEFINEHEDVLKELSYR
ncbi:MAG: AbrB/MazE/SpoVT family DNA-binding domain-containing protein [Patescibacteria group bacterium]